MKKYNLWIGLSMLLTTTACGPEISLGVAGETIAATAEGYEESTDWAQNNSKVVYGGHGKKGAVKFSSGMYKCNLFVYDVLKEAGATAPVHLTETRIVDGSNRVDLWPATAGSWANPTIDIPDWQHIGNSGNFERGDVIAVRNNSGDATGHCGIAVSNDQVIYTSPSIVKKSRFKAYTIRRYTGS